MKNHLISITRASSMYSRRFTVAFLLCVSLALLPSPSRAASDAKRAGVPLLQAQLPAGTSIQQADCEVLSRAVSRATLAHRAEAPAILKAALTNGSAQEEVPRKEDQRACECVARIVHASVKAAPAQASALMEVVMALYPDCADSLASILEQSRRDLGYGSPINAPVAGINNVGATSGDAGATTSNAGASNGFGGGFGPGFPGTPGFGGSAPSGGFALPSPGATPVTSSVNQ